MLDCTIPNRAGIISSCPSLAPAVLKLPFYMISLLRFFILLYITAADGTIKDFMKGIPKFWSTMKLIARKDIDTTRLSTHHTTSILDLFKKHCHHNRLQQYLHSRKILLEH
ncbi:hypothetical protein POM88_030744 [Heracleum sosnowskyi]|uniref:Uncharacterized protein n=1 Tax=Heracleum sosnowskyi TaxID=360622 RepID=A0AAD8MIF5_9APIA|nr:hypothetical protein POM88_030744 [Heracleum sosnowskyi]